jgi:hypothetical protein
MNSVERIVHYATAVEQEAPHQIPGINLPASWPEQGGIELKDVILRYREGLPPVLKGMYSLQIIIHSFFNMLVLSRYINESCCWRKDRHCGTYWRGKKFYHDRLINSLILASYLSNSYHFPIALYRIVELSQGTIAIDNIDISKIGLSDLRNKLAIIPQDPVSYHDILLG